MRRLLIIGLTLIGLQAYSQEVRWENITALHYAATGGSDLEHTLQQYLLFDSEVLNSHEQLFEQYRSFTEEQIKCVALFVQNDECQRFKK